jgi:CubicO group peptidase (beta-lactamase class C family)
MQLDPSLENPLVFNGPATPSLAGLPAAKLARVKDVFQRQLAEGWHPGAQMVVVWRGQVVVDLADGLAQVRRRRPVLAETPFLTFSTSKPFSAMCLHRLLEAGQVELDAPIATYWPAFGCKGKETATVRHALLHQAGIPLRGLYIEALLCPNWDWVTRYVASLPAEFPPGTQTAYHLVNGGYLIGEVVRRVSGLPIEGYLRQHFLEPLGLRHSWLGLPYRQHARAAAVYAGSPDQREAVFFFSAPQVRRAVIPAASLNSTARDLAVFYQMLLNGGAYAGTRYLQSETIARATALHYDGYDRTFRGNTQWGLGFHLGCSAKSDQADTEPMGKGSSCRTYGHMGQGASAMAWADPDADLVFAFTCNRLLNWQLARARLKSLADAVWEMVA